MCFVAHVLVFDDAMTFEYLKRTFEYLKNEESFRSEIEKTFPCFTMLSFRLTKETSKNVAETTFKNGLVHY